MKGSIYKLGMVLESKKNKYRVEIVQIDKELINGRPPKYTYRVKYLNAINMYKTIGTHTIDKYYKVVK